MSDIPSTNSSPSSSSPMPGGPVDRLREEANRKARELELQDRALHDQVLRDQEGGNSLTDQARSAMRAAGDEASGLASEFKSRARDYAESGKRTGADRLESLAGAAGRLASEIEQDSPETARFIQKAAEGTQRFSSRMRDRSVDDLVSDARDVARRQPLLVFGGAVVAGLVLARFLKSSKPASGRDSADAASGRESRFYARNSARNSGDGYEYE